MTKSSGSTSNKPSKPTFEEALGSIPKKFRTRLVKEYKAIKKRHSQAILDAEYDIPGLSTGKFVETLLRFLQYELTGTFTPFGQHISNFPDECRKLGTVNDFV
jgi:hypothetical protein